METNSNSPGCGGGRSFVAFLATAIFIIAFLLIFVGMVAPDWLAVDDQRAPSSTKFQKLGLWMSCYKLLHDPYYYDPYLTGGYEGCRWIYYPVTATVNDLREFILPGFLVPVQICYTLGFVAGMICLILVLLFWAKFTAADTGMVPFLIVVGLLCNTSALLASIAVVAFGSLSASRLWAPEWQFNYLAWAFTVAVVGAILEHIAGILFLIEAFIQWQRRKRLAYNGSYAFGGGGYGKKP